MKPFKIRTVNESHSREIQEWLFSLGYSWNCGSRDVREVKATFLFLEKSIFEDDLTLSYGFETKNLPEAWFYEGQIHYEPKPQTLPEFKIKVESPEHSRKIQAFVFSMGYSWWTMFNEPNQEVKHLDEEYLYFTKSGIKNKLLLSATNNTRLFNSLNIPEMWFYGGKLRDEPSQLEPQPYTYRQVAEALLAGENLECLVQSGNWIPINYIGLHKHRLDKEFPDKVRVKPRICNGVELDPCLTEYPEMDSYYYYPDPMHVDYYNSKPWANDADDIYWFELGFAYATPNSAAKHGQAMGLYI